MRIGSRKGQFQCVFFLFVDRVRACWMIGDCIGALTVFLYLLDMIMVANSLNLLIYAVFNL